MRGIIAALFLFMGSPVVAGEIDYFCIFSNAASAQADANVGVFWDAAHSSWDTSTVFPGISVSTPAALVNGISPITGLWLLVARPSADAGLDADSACVMKWDRDAVAVVSASLTGTNRTSASFKPVPFGSNYAIPFGK